MVAIIGVLASVVLASLNTARGKGTEAAIKSNLKNMIAQAELSYSDIGDYSGVCAAVAKMLAAINSAGGASACYSNNNSGYSDVNLRWGASAKKSDGTKNWSSDSSGVVVFDTIDTGTTQTWDAANTACASAGGRLPSMEQLRALYDAYGTTPTGFTTSAYWSSTTVPSDINSAYYVYMTTGGAPINGKNGYHYVRCVH